MKSPLSRGKRAICFTNWSKRLGFGFAFGSSLVDAGSRGNDGRDREVAVDDRGDALRQGDFRNMDAVADLLAAEVDIEEFRDRIGRAMNFATKSNSTFRPTTFRNS